MESISVDLDTMEEVRYKMRSFLVGSPTARLASLASLAETPDHLTTTHIPAYRLFETKKYNGTLGPPGPLVPKAPSTGCLGAAAQEAPSTGCLGAAAQAHCCICLDEIKKNCMIVSMPLCGHIYHKACLFNWVDLSKNTFCPYCKQDDF